MPSIASLRSFRYRPQLGHRHEMRSSGPHLAFDETRARAMATVPAALDPVCRLISIVRGGRSQPRSSSDAPTAGVPGQERLVDEVTQVGTPGHTLLPAIRLSRVIFISCVSVFRVPVFRQHAQDESSGSALRQALVAAYL